MPRGRKRKEEVVEAPAIVVEQEVVEEVAETFKFALDEAVVIAVSGETGKVIGRAEYLTSCPMYFVHYKAADGRAVIDWWAESTLVSAAAPKRGRRKQQ